MNAADIIVVHSITSKKWKEQFGRVAPESMACGRAVLVSDSGTLKELVPDKSFIVHEQDIDALAKAIEKLLLNPELRAEMGMKAHLHAHKLYTMKMQAKRITEIE
jgi:glycosyltransferase involved in cell wall biosynthesis